ncbi:MAG: hypothetical protein J7L44_04335 [Candidatus Diapherotrites archaeon]|nr:hypothetical protein [Candidatus Diapherotrites archaeon]
MIAAYAILSMERRAEDSSTGFPEEYSLESVRISLSTGGGLSPLIISKVTIFGNGTVKQVILYNRDRFTSEFKEGKISEDDVKRLLEVFKANNFFDLQDSYEDLAILDLPGTDVSLKIDGKEKSVRLYGTAGPIQIQNIMREVRKTIEKTELKESNDSSVCEILDSAGAYKYTCYCDFYTKSAIANNNPKACEALKKYPKPKYWSGSCYDTCYLELALDRNDAKLCTKIEDAERKERCISDIANNLKDENSCDLLAGENRIRCYAKVSALKNDPYVCLKLEEKKDIIDCIIYSDWDEKEVPIEPHCEKFENLTKRDLCYYIAKDCNKITSSIEYGHGYPYMKVREVCILHNIKFLWKRYGSEKAISLCKEILFQFYQGVCLSKLAEEVKAINKNEAIEICNMISQEERRESCLSKVGR